MNSAISVHDNYKHALNNITHYFPDKRQVRIEQNFLISLLTYQRLPHEAHELMNQTLRKSLMAALASKMELQDLH